MKHQFFLQILTSAILLTGVNADNVVASAQFSGEKLITPMDKMLSQGPGSACEDYDLLEGLVLTPEQERSARAAIDRYKQAWSQMADRAESEGRDISDTELDAINELFVELFTHLEQELGPEQFQRFQFNYDRPYYSVFEGISLTPQQLQFARAEFYRYDQAFTKMVDPVVAEGRDFSDAELQALNSRDDELFARLEQGLSPEQVQQIRDNLDPVYGMFEEIELTPEQDQFVRAEIDRYEQALNEITDLADSEGRAFSDIENEFLTRLEQRLSPEQIRQVRGNFDPLYAQFNITFEGIELTPEQDQFALAEIERYYKATDVIFDQAESEGRGFSESDLQTINALEDEFLTRLEQGLDPEQVRQVRGNIDPIYSLFDEIELTPKQDQFVRTEIVRYKDRYNQTFNAIIDRVESEDRGFSDSEEQALDAIDNEFLTRLEKELSPEQVQQVRVNFTYALSPEEACLFGS